MKALVLAGLVLCSSTVFAQPKKEAAAAYKAGQALYMKEDYEGAATQFKAAHDLDPDPVYLFNAAQALRLAKQCKDAGDYYRRYLTDAKKAPNADAVNAYIAEVDECAKAQEPVVVAPPPPVVEAPPEVQPAPPAQSDRPSGGKKRLVGYIVGGAGVGLVGLGVVFMSQVSGFEDDANAVCPNPCMEWDPRKTEARERIDDKAALREKLMIGSWIAGGAALAAGIYLVVTGGEQTEASIAITPTRNGAMASFRF
jgi:tetratricopeptide (TPR) repeat protein